MRAANRRAGALAPLALLWAAAAAPAADLVAWGQETWRLEPGETFQFRVEFAQIPVRSWRLVIDGGQLQSDLTVRREADGSLLYARRNEAHHEVTVPWGQGEAIAVAIAPGRVGGGLYTATFLGPPRDAAPESHSYRVNRALEAYAAGDAALARRLAEAALQEDPDDDAALLLMSGFLRADGDTVRAEGLRARALGLELAACDSALARAPGAPAAARAALLRRRGLALRALGRPYEAVDAFAQGLALAPPQAEQARLHLHLGLVQRDLGNAAQARAALALARRQGLSPEMDAEAAAALAQLEANGD